MLAGKPTKISSFYKDKLFLIEQKRFPPTEVLEVILPIKQLPAQIQQ